MRLSFSQSPRGRCAMRKTRVLPPHRRRSKNREGRGRTAGPDIGFATGHDDLLLVEARNVIGNRLLFGQVEEIFFEDFRRTARVRADLFGQGALSIDGPLEGYDHRNSEVAEQASEVLRVRLDLGPQAVVHLR